MLRYLARRNITDLARASYEMLSNVIPSSTQEAMQALDDLTNELSRLEHSIQTRQRPWADGSTDPRQNVKELAKIVAEYHLASVPEVYSTLESQRLLAVLKWETLTSDILPRADFGGVSLGVNEQHVSGINGFLRGQNPLNALYDLAAKDTAEWMRQIFQRDPQDELGYSIAPKRLREYVWLVRPAFQVMLEYSVYLGTIEEFAAAQGIDTKPFDKKAFDTDSDPARQLVEKRPPDAIAETPST